jgi:hypothetical protein
MEFILHQNVRILCKRFVGSSVGVAYYLGNQEGIHNNHEEIKQAVEIIDQQKSYHKARI